MADLRVVTNEPNQSVIDLLEDLLEKAKAGKIDAIAGVAGVANSCMFAEFFSGNTQEVCVPMLGYLRVLQLRYEDMIERD